MTNERWLRWAIARYYRSHGFRVSIRPARVGNTMVDGVAIGPEGERIAIEVKSPRDGIVRGIGLGASYSRAVLVTTLRVAGKPESTGVIPKAGEFYANPLRQDGSLDYAGWPIATI